ncbi:hypothetical protein LPUS_01302 [Lasallia pustulata]|uniref:Uncharacterized protein n=1 Tax=Lasallia pustulata TaxID=136370 RepID=A0A1W5D9Y7_9LECA|nr:hypothetical protein LPUS_01302 [Lasallia pustulata]
MYEELYQKQESIVKSGMDHYTIAQAIVHFPKLESSRLSVDGKVCPPSIYQRKAHQAGLVRTFGDYGSSPFAPGLRQALSVLPPGDIPREKAYRKLRIFHAGALSWKIFTARSTVVTAMCKGLQHLTDLKLIITTDRAEIPMCEEGLKTTLGLQKFVTGVPPLRKSYMRL